LGTVEAAVRGVHLLLLLLLLQLRGVYLLLLGLDL
jgi:hypothetical protein